MSAIYSLKFSPKFIQTVCFLLVILSYLTTPFLNVIAAVISALYLLSSVSWQDKFSVFFFVFPFAPVMKYNPEATSIFLVLRFAIIISALIYSNKIFNNPKIYLSLFFMILYDIVVSLGNEGEFFLRLLNLSLWLVIIYCMQAIMTEDDMLPVSRSFVNGMIISSIVGMNLDKIPNMRRAVRDLSLYVNAELVDSRFTGLFNDPNFYTVLVCVCLWICFIEFKKGNISTMEFAIRNLIVTFFGTMTYSKSCVILLVLFWMYVFLSRSTIKFSTKFVVGIAFSIFVIYFFLINSDWLTNMNARFGMESRTADSLTTGRTTIWMNYLKYMYTTGSWVWGNGLSFLFPYGRGSHNTIIQCFYCVGVVGTCIHCMFIKKIYRATPREQLEVKPSGDSIVFLGFIFLTMFFLDALFQETYYYALSFCFVYMKKYANTSELELPQRNLVNKF